MVGKSRTTSSRRWLDRQHADCYVQQAKQAGFRARSAYKLLEIQEKDKILQKGMGVVDLGAAPGGWAQVAVQVVGETGYVLAIDILPMENMTGVDIVLGDFREKEVFDKLVSKLNEKPVDLVMSDMSPNLSGIPMVDQARSMELAEMALEFAEIVLVKNGNFLVKVFQGSGLQKYEALLKERFSRVIVRKPKASRAESREVYLLAKGYFRPSEEEKGLVS